MKLTSKTRSVASKPTMLSAYTRWVSSKLITGKPPRLPLSGGSSIGKWLSFSEYWMFHDVIPEPERLWSALLHSGLSFG
jgi:hypothetical protein